MKVTALIPDSLINDIKKLSKGKNITDSLIIALRDWIAIQKVKTIHKKIEKKPLKFNFTSESLRELNRKR
jgi:hypothetical protein